MLSTIPDLDPDPKDFLSPIPYPTWKELGKTKPTFLFIAVYGFQKQVIFEEHFHNRH
jgi:hypothetical protein